MEPVIYVIDDDVMVCRSLDRFLSTAGYTVITYATSMAFLGIAPSLPAGCALVDLRMPLVDGLELQERLLQMKVALPVIVMSGHGDVPSAVRAMRAGAVDFIEKPFNDDALLIAIAAALKDERPYRDVAEAAVRIAMLSRREREVLDALVAGRSNKLVAFDLGISVRTVEVHRARTMDRLGVREFPQAVRLAVLASLEREP